MGNTPIKSDDAEFSMLEAMLADGQAAREALLVAILKKFKAAGTAHGELINAWQVAAPDDFVKPGDPWYDTAEKLYCKDSSNDVELDDKAVVSRGDNGAFVQMWGYVSNAVYRANGGEDLEGGEDAGA